MAAAITTGDGVVSFSPPHCIMGVTPFKTEHDIAATTEFDESGDGFLLAGPFPSGAYFPAFAGTFLRITVPDLDSNGTPAITLDAGIGDSDGVIDTELAADSTAGQAGGDIDNAAQSGGLIDIGGKYIILKVDTAPATANASLGTIVCEGWYVEGVLTAGSDPSVP